MKSFLQILKRGIFTLLFCYTIADSSFAQTPGMFYGVTESDPYTFSHSGYIYQYNATTNQTTVLHYFDTTGLGGSTYIERGTDGLLYGAARAIYSYDLASNQINYLYEFDADSGTSHYDLIEGDSGIFYGVTFKNTGGYFGTIYSYNTNTSLFSQLYVFDTSNGFKKSGPITLASDGNLYGFAYMDTSKKVYRFNPGNLQFDFILDLDTILSYGEAGKINAFFEAPNETLYCLVGESFTHHGALFSLDINSMQGTKLVDFDTLVQKYPVGKLMLANNGQLYGATYSSIFRYDVLNNQVITESLFSNACSCDPNGYLMQAMDGKIYGVGTSWPGFSSSGEIFNFDPVAHLIDSLFSFNDVALFGHFIYHYDGLIQIPFGVSAPTLSKINIDQIFPNPSDGLFSVSNLNNYTSLEIRDVLGRRIYSKTVTVDNKNNSVQIDLRAAANGIYYITLSDSKTTVTEKIVIQH